MKRFYRAMLRAASRGKNAASVKYNYVYGMLLLPVERRSRCDQRSADLSLESLVSVSPSPLVVGTVVSSTARQSRRPVDTIVHRQSML